LHNKFAFNGNGPQIEQIAEKNTKHKEKKITKGPQINPRRSPNIFEIF